MPLPTPHDGETRDDFMSRCMSELNESDEFKDQAERAAACDRQWRESKNAAPELVRKAMTAKIDDADDSAWTLVAKINTDSVDRDGEVVWPGGMDIGRYKGLVLWQHDYGPNSLPPAKNLWIKPNRKRNPTEIVAKTQFDAKREFARDLYWLYKDRYLTDWSIGAENVQRRGLTPEDLKANPHWEGAEFVWEKWGLIEYSGVKVGSNPDTATDVRTMTKEFKDSHEIADETLEALGIQLAEPPPPPPEPAPERIVIRRIGHVELPKMTLVGMARKEDTIRRIAAEEIARRRGRMTL